MLIPIPFVSGAIGAAMGRHTAETFEASDGQISPYNIVLVEMQGSPLFRAAGGAMQLRPFAFLKECIDDKYRIAWVFQLQGGGWSGCYGQTTAVQMLLRAPKAPS